MIIQCPECSTGFNLPDKHITPKGAKLRCSRCSHVFRVRRSSPEDEVEIFYKPEDEQANATSNEAPSSQDEASQSAGAASSDSGEGLAREESVAIELDALLGAANEVEPHGQSTEIGLPTASSAPSTPSRPDLSGYGFGSSNPSEMDDPFPLAGGSVKNLKQKIKISVPKPSSGGLAGSSQTTEDPAEQDASPTAGIDLFGDELGPAELDSHDPFAGAFQEDSLDPDSFAQSSEVSSAASQPAPSSNEVPILQPGQPAQHAAAAVASDPRPAALPEPDAQPLAATPAAAPAAMAPQEEQPSLLQGRSGGAFVDAGDLVDPSFGSEGASFDPQQGVVQAPSRQVAPAASAQASPAPTTAQAASAAQAQRAAATTNATAKKAQPDFEDSWPTQADAIAAHRIGGGGMQKVANLVLIVLLVLVGFLGLVAALNDGMLDFKQFGSMIEVAFGGGDYKPRPEWTPPPKPQPKPVVEAPLRTESVWAEIVTFGKKQDALVVRGLLRNFDQKNYSAVTMRGIVLDKKEKIIAEKVFPLGTHLTNAAIGEQKSVSDIQALLDNPSPPLNVASSEPFTIVFDDIPEDVVGGEPVFFRVDVAKSEAVGGE